MLIRLLPMFLLCALAACGSNNESNTPGSPILGDSCGQYPSFEQTYKSRIDKIIQFEEGNTCFVVREFNQSQSKFSIKHSHWQYRLECVDAQSKLLQCYSAKEGDVIKDIVRVADDQFIVAELKALPKAEGLLENGYTLQLQRKNLTGEILSEQTLTDAPEDKELIYYDTDLTNGTLTKEIEPSIVYQQNIPVLFEMAEVELKWYNNQLHLLVATYGLKYYKLDASLHPTFDETLVPAHSLLWLLTQDIRRISALTITEAGDAVISINMNPELQTFFEDYFAQTLELADGDVNQLLTIIKPGSATQRFMIGKPDEKEFIVGAESIGDEIWLTANVRKAKPNAAGGTTEWDVALMSVNTHTGQLKAYFELHQNQEDMALEFTAVNNDLFLISGQNGYSQVDTNSQVTNGQGFNWLVNRQGQIIDSELVSGLRDTLVNEVSVYDNRIVYAKVYDGPITHTCDNDELNQLCYDKTVIEQSRLYPQ